MPEFRWILLGLGLLLLGGIWWWGNRRPQARGNAELRDSEPSSHFSTTIIADHTLAAHALGNHPPTVTIDPPGPAPAAFAANPIIREPSVSPYEPLRISARDAPPVGGEYDLPIMVEPAVDSQIVQIDDVQMLVESTAVDPAAVTTQLPETPPPPAQNPPQSAIARDPAPADNGGTRRPVDAEVRAPRTDTSGRFARVKPPEVKPAPSPPSQLQKIVAVRVCAIADGSWDGTDLATAFAGSDLVHGRYGVFHRLHSDGRSIFCVASLVEPGSFDPQRMPEQRFPGISIFAVLPGPLEPVQTFEEVMTAARQLAQDLSGMMQDEKGGPLSPQRAGTLREEVVRFQQLLRADAPH